MAILLQQDKTIPSWTWTHCEIASPKLLKNVNFKLLP